MKRLFALLLIVSSLSAKDPLFTVTGLLQPESVIYDSARECYYVSNINGVPNEKDGNGFISIIRNDSLVNLRWVEGLDAPKGLAISGDFLYVTDIDQIHKINIKTESVIESIVVKNALFLNDITSSPEGDLFISDMMSGIIHRLSDSQIEPWFTNSALSMPNGLCYHKGALIVGTWGRGMKENFETEELGALFSIKLKSKKVTKLSTELQGNLDGVALKGRNIFIVSDYINGKIYEVSSKGSRELMQLHKGSADITYNPREKRLLVPQMAQGTLEVHSL